MLYELADALYRSRQYDAAAQRVQEAIRGFAAQGMAKSRVQAIDLHASILEAGDDLGEDDFRRVIETSRSALAAFCDSSCC